MKGGNWEERKMFGKLRKKQQKARKEQEDEGRGKSWKRKQVGAVEMQVQKEVKE